jgi:WD40 repeat protein
VRIRDHSASLELWDAATGQVVRSFGTGDRVSVLAVNATHVAFTLPTCPRECPIYLSHLASGETKRVTVPPDWHSGAAEFSPDGGTLAVVGVRSYDGLPGENRLLLVDVAEGRTRAARSLDPRNEPLSLISWAPDGDWVFTASRGRGSNVLGYQVRESRLRHVVDARRGIDVTFDDLTGLAAF